MSPYQLFLVVVLFTTTSLVAASPAASRTTPPPIPRLLSRAIDTCQQNYTQCPSSNVCCPNETTCIPLSNGTQVACCGINEDCRIVQPLTCGTDAAKGGETCTAGASAGKCCPGGYVCAGDFCQMPFEDWPTQYGGTVTLAPTAAVTAAPDNNNNNNSDGTCATFPPAALASGFFPGLVVGALLIAAISFCIDRRRQRQVQTFKRMPETSPVPAQNVPSRFQSQHSATKSMQEMVICFAPDANPNLALAAEAERRGRPRVHGETPQLPSVHGFPDDRKQGHTRKESQNPSYQTSNNHAITHYDSTEKLRCNSMSSDTTVSSSVHSSIHPNTRNVSGQRYPIAVPSSALQVRTSMPYSYDASTPTTIDDSTPTPTHSIVPPHAPDAPPHSRDRESEQYTAGSAYPNSVYEPYFIPTPATPVPAIPPLFAKNHVTSPIDVCSPLEEDISPIGASIARIGTGGSYEMVVGMSQGTPVPAQGPPTRVGVPLGQSTMNAGRYTLHTQQLNRI